MIFTLYGKVRLMKWNTAVSTLQRKEVTWCISPTNRRPKKTPLRFLLQRKEVTWCISPTNRRPKKTPLRFFQNVKEFYFKRKCVWTQTALRFPADLFLSEF